MTAELQTIDHELLPEVDITFDQARSFVDELKLKVKRVNGSIDEIQLDLATFYAQDGWQVLGYGSWDEFMLTEMKTKIKLPRADRQSLALVYRKAGMSQQAIAQVLGVDQKTVSNDLKSSQENSSEDEPLVVKSRDGKVIDPENQQRFTCTKCQARKPFDTRIELDDGLYCEPCAEAVEQAAQYSEDNPEPIDAEVVADPAPEPTRLQGLQDDVSMWSQKVPWTKANLKKIQKAMTEIEELMK
jgi:predicted transcriptional regulator